MSIVSQRFDITSPGPLVRRPIAELAAEHPRKFHNIGMLAFRGLSTIERGELDMAMFRCQGVLGSVVPVLASLSGTPGSMARTEGEAAELAFRALGALGLPGLIDALDSRAKCQAGPIDMVNYRWPAYRFCASLDQAIRREISKRK